MLPPSISEVATEGSPSDRRVTEKLAAASAALHPELFGAFEAKART
jgi:hypothetical protein